MRLIAKAGIGCAVVLLTCIGGVGVVVYRVASGTIKPTVDYAGQIEALIAAEQPNAATEPDRWNNLVALLEKTQKINMEVWKKNGLTTGAPDTLQQLEPSVLRGAAAAGDLAKEQAAARELLTELKVQKVFGEMRDLAKGGRFVRPLKKGGPLIEILLPDLPTARIFARSAAAQMRVSHLAGDYEPYLEAFEGVCGEGQNYMRQGILIDRLVGQAIFMLALTELEQGMIEKPLPAEVIKECEKILERTSVVPIVTLSIETERRSVKDTIQWTFSDTGNGDGYFLPGARVATTFWGTNGMAGQRPSPLGSLAGLVMAGRAETTKKADEIFDATIVYARTARPTRVVRGISPDVEVEKLTGRMSMLKALVPALGTMAAKNDETMMYFAATRQLLATELFMREHGEEPPAKARELVPRYLKELPTDPINGMPFGYVVLKPGEDAYGRRYLLYSLGSDGLDNHGTQAVNPAERMSAVKMNRNGVIGIDLVMNEPGEGARKKAAGEPEPLRK